VSAQKKSATEQLHLYVTDITTNLMVTTQCFQQPLAAGAESEMMPSVSKAWIRQIFANTEQIYQMNRQLKDMLQSRLNNWDNVQRIGDIFMKMVSGRLLSSVLWPLLMFVGSCLSSRST
jgi:hypothetical protein